MGVARSTQLSEPLQWPAEGVTRIPFRLFSDEEIYSLEQERIIRGAGLALSVPRYWCAGARSLQDDDHRRRADCCDPR